jgi:hypothetical protein
MYVDIHVEYYTDISCLGGGLFAKNTSRETKKFSLKTGIFRKYPSQTWYICLITSNIN